MIAWVFAWRSNKDAADAFAESLRATGEYETVIRSNARYYQGEVNHGGVTFHDGAVQLIQWAHDEAGVRCEQFGAPRTTIEPPVQETEPEAEPEDASHTAPETGHRLEQFGAWWKVIGPDGKLVGKAHRTEANARKALADLI